jgi:hypothetical protein
VAHVVEYDDHGSKANSGVEVTVAVERQNVEDD